MKNKTLKKLLCFLLAFVVMVSTPLNLQVSALAIESWVIWAIVTYLTSVGLIFTATGGAQAVYDAVEEKVNQYGDNVIDFYDIVRGNLRIVKPPNLPPNWNPDLGNLFITAVGVEALGRFAEWLTSDGGWLAGTTVTKGYSFGTFDVQRRNGNSYSDLIPCATSLIGELETSNSDSSYKRANILLEGSSFLSADTLDEVCTIDTNGNRTTKTYYSQSEKAYFVYENNTRIAKVKPLLINTVFNLGVSVDDFSSSGQITFALVNEKINVGVAYNGYFYLLAELQDVRFVGSTLSADIEIPEELPEIKPLPTLEGLLLESETLAADSLEALGNVVETYFNDAGTIPAPQPNIIPDPEAAPEPTPVPTPAPSPEIEDIGDLGLPTLGEAIFNKFPFSLPKDLKRISDILNAEPVTPKWEVDLYETLGDRIPFRGSTKLTIDLEEYEQLGQISRWASVISFVVFLIIITKGVIRW